MKKRTNRFTELKYLLIVLSLVVTLGLWNIFASEGTQDASAQSSLPDNPAALATLIPLSDIALPEKPPAVQVTSQQLEDTELREVTQPTTTIVQKRPPVVEQVTLGQPAPASNESGSSNAPQPVTNTGSSK